MGMHFGLIIAKASVHQLRNGFSRAWPEFEVVVTEDRFSNPEAVWGWVESHQEFVSAARWTKDNPGKSAYVLWQDGPWAVFLDSGYTLASNTEKLKLLSSHLGTVASFVLETAGGCAFFWCFENGQLRREISNSDGNMKFEGEPLIEEVGIEVSRYYMDETEALWKAFGLSSLEVMPRMGGCEAICVVDHTDYGSR